MKILSRLLINLFEKYLFFLFIINTIFIYIKQHHLVKLMNIEQFNLIYQKQSNSINVIRIIIFILLLLTIFEFPTITSNSCCQSIWISLLQFITGITMTINVLIFWFIIHYIKQGTIYVLDEILENQIIIDNVNMIEINIVHRSSIKQIEQLANHNRIANRILSFPLMIHFSVYILDTLIIINDFITNNGSITSMNISYTITIWLYFIYIIRMDIKINRLIEKIIEIIIKNETIIQQNSIDEETLLLSLTSARQRSLLIKYIKIFKQIKFFLQKITIMELNELYGQDFKLKIYQLRTINLTFFLDSFLFVLAYSVLVYQTFNY